MVFLSYPKYYRTTEGNLEKVETSLVPSTDPEWDYEVVKGIWQLKIKKDGTFRASHAGDTFTYRFNSLGFGRGSQFRAVDWDSRISAMSVLLVTPSAGAMFIRMWAGCTLYSRYP